MAVGRVRTGVLLISIGLLLLLNTTGVVDFGFWHWIGKLWPVILIAIGIEKIFSSSQSSAVRNLAWLSPLLIVAVVGYAVVAGEREETRDPWSGNWNWHWDGDDGGSTSTSSWTEAFASGAQRVKLSLDMSGGRLTVRGGSEPGQVLVARASSRGDQPKSESTISGEVQTIRIVQRDKPDNRGRDQWTIKLSDSLPVDLEVDGGAARMRFDLTAVKAESLELDAAAAEVDVVFGTLAQTVSCNIDCAAAAIDITIPSNAGLRLRHEGLISKLSESSLDLVDRGNFSETAEYDANPVKIDLKVNSAVTSLRLRRASGPAPGESI